MHALLALADTAGYQSGYGAGRRGVIADVVRRSARGIRGDLECRDPSMGRGDARSGSDGCGRGGHAVQMTYLLGEPPKAVRCPLSAEAFGGKRVLLFPPVTRTRLAS